MLDLSFVMTNTNVESLSSYALKIFNFHLLIIIFGYFEKIWNCGYVISICIAAYSVIFNSSIPAAIVVGLEYYLWLSDMKYASYFCFLILVSIFFDKKTSEDNKVRFNPKEAEIRKYLFKRNPSLLHTVDSALQEYRGREDELLQKYKTQCEISEHSDCIRTSKTSDLNFSNRNGKYGIDDHY